MKKIYRGFCWIEETICAIGFLTMIALVFLSAVARTAGHPLAWSIDVSQLLLCWVTLIGADIAFRKKKILGLDLFTSRFPIPVQRVLEIAMDVIIAIALCIFIRYGTRLSFDSWKRTFQTLKLSYSYITMALPIMSALMLVSVGVDLYDLIRHFNRPLEEKNRKEADA